MNLEGTYFLILCQEELKGRFRMTKKNKISQRQRSVSNGIDCSPIASVCIISGTRRDHNYHVIIYNYCSYTGVVKEL